MYSDVPPPASIPASNILQGGKKTATPVPPAPNTNAPATPDAKPEGSPKAEEKKATPKSTSDLDLEFRKRQQEKAEKEKKDQDKADQETRRQQLCERAKGYLRSLESGVRIAETTANGERKVYDDAQRAREIEDTKKQLSDNKCN